MAGRLPDMHNPLVEAQLYTQEFLPHALTSEQVAAQLGTCEHGLTVREAQQRLQHYGANEIEQIEPINILRLIWHQFQSPLIYILMIAAVVTLFLGEYIDAGVIAAVLILNATIGFIQEFRAEKSVRALMQLTAPRALVLREGKEHDIPSRELVPGDVVLLESGVRVPADIRLFQATALQVDESLLTGESVPVYKQVAPVPPETPLADRANMLFSGTIVVSGRGRGYVVATGARTELGKIAGSIRAQRAEETPLQQRMRRFADIIGIVIGVSCVVIFALGLAIGNSAIDMFKVAVGVAVAAIPEGLPIVLTITLALRVSAMAKRNALVRRLHAVETLGSTTVIGSDKTGTLTENRMTVQEYWTAGEWYRISELQAHEVPREDEHPFVLALLTSVLTNEAHVRRIGEDEYEIHGDPTEAALLIAALKAGFHHEEWRARHPVVGEIPFEPELQYSASLRARGEEHWMFVKGAPERVLRMSTRWLTPDGELPLDANAYEEVMTHAQAMATRGLRVLGLAYRRYTEPVETRFGVPEPADLVFIGLVGMMDPPRPGVLEAIRECHQAGIRVLMITGDHAATARAIAAQLEIAPPDAEVITGADLERMSDEELRERVRTVNVFARVSPEHKLRVVRALQANGEVVAVTGDGVNDAPALKAAEVGIAMGKSGTDVAREAADIVLADDNFVSIRNAVEEGRVAFKNLRNATFFLLSTGAGSVLMFLFAVLLGLPMPMLPAQLLWLNLVTNGLQDVAMAFEPGDKSIMRQRPRPREEGILSNLLWERTVIVGLLIAVSTLWLFMYEYESTGSLTRAQTVALTTVVLFQNFHVGNARSEFRSVFLLSPLRNPFLLIAVIVATSVHAVALYLPFTQFVLRVEPIELEAWLRSALVALSVVVVVEAHKWLRHPKLAREGI
ncbi:MAG: HAD-IC family P-type ATPase [Armatimonadota bacterium]|nr:HAD-IC family P-type ATPase [Armatimonadota bacterium]